MPDIKAAARLVHTVALTPAPREDDWKYLASRLCRMPTSEEEQVFADVWREQHARWQQIRTAHGFTN